MSLDTALLVNVAKYFRYDGTNGAELAEFFSMPYDEESRSVFEVTIESERDDTLVLVWEGGWRNWDNTVWEMRNEGTTTVHKGDYLQAAQSASGLACVPASLIGETYAVITPPEE